MGRRSLLKPEGYAKLLGVPSDEESLIRHYTLSPQDRFEALARRRPHNQLGFAVQLCLMRHPGRMLASGERPPEPMITYVADQLGLNPEAFSAYADREETRLEHGRHLQQYLSVKLPAAEDRRAALVAALDAAAAGDRGDRIVEAMIGALRARRSLMLPEKQLDRIGLAARALARGKAHTALLQDLSAEQLGALDKLLDADPAIRQTRFGWLPRRRVPTI
ncbi:MAG: DUF4158 domain-containing protein [Aliidongia sp.]